MTEEAKHTPISPTPEAIAAFNCFREATAWGCEAEDALASALEAYRSASDAELTTLRTKLAEAVKALRDTPCPRPCNGRPDDFTAGQCFDALECGCSTGSALSQAQDPS